jgi:hypothetical protein
VETLQGNYGVYIQPAVVKKTHHADSESEEDRNCQFLKQVTVSISDAISVELPEDVEARGARQKKKIADLQEALES